MLYRMACGHKRLTVLHKPRIYADVLDFLMSALHQILPSYPWSVTLSKVMILLRSDFNSFKDITWLKGSAPRSVARRLIFSQRHQQQIRDKASLCLNAGLFYRLPTDSCSGLNLMGIWHKPLSACDLHWFRHAAHLVPTSLFGTISCVFQGNNWNVTRASGSLEKFSEYFGGISSR